MDSYTMEEYSSGCESGWTVYFEQSTRSYVDDDDDDEGCVNRSEEEEEIEEDLSMVSDASSGPAGQVGQDNNTKANCYINNGGMFYSVSTDEDGALLRNKQQKRRRRKTTRPSENGVEFNQDCMLDDTASSRPDFNYKSTRYDDQGVSSMTKMMDVSHDHFSTSYFQGGGASSSAVHSYHYDDHQMHFHQQYNW